MSRLLLIGTGPLFAPEVRMLNGQALRTWHLAKPLLEAGHALDIAVLPTEGHSDDSTADSGTLIQQQRRGEVVIHLVRTAVPEYAKGALQGLIDRNRKGYDGIIGVNLNAAALAVKICRDKPFWADLNGYTMGEAQTKCRVHNSDEWLRHFWSRQRGVLRRADRFSAVSMRQKHATLAELATLGRMNQYTFDYPYCSVIPNAVSEDLVSPLARRQFERESSASAETKPAPAAAPIRFRGILFPERTFTVLWTGGFNTWTDTAMLAGALSLAMEQSNNLRFVCSGGAIPGHDEISFRQFQEQMTQTGFADRCHYLGWVESGDLEALHRECDLAVNVDSMNYETYFGARNRITNWMGLGIPIVTTVGTEISEILQDEQLAYTVKPGDVVALSEVFLRAEKNPAERKQYGARARRFALENFNYEATTRGLLRWAEDPHLAPDNEERRKLAAPGQPLEDIVLNDLEAETAGIIDNLAGTVRHLQAELDGIRSHPLFQAYKSVQRWIKK